MTTATVTTNVDHTSDAGYNAWVSEIITLLFTTLGLTQTADTGQTTGSGLTRPGTSTMNAYIVGRFNDTAQATTPIFFRIDFGTGTSAAVPMMRLTVGTGSNGSGTITGAATFTAMGICNNTAITSTVNPFVTRACYNTTAGVLWLAWKIGANGTAGCAEGGFAIYRSADNTGAVTTDAFNVITNGAAANSNGVNNSACFLTAFSHLTGLSYNTAPFPTSSHSFVPFALTATINGGNAQIAPFFQYTPVIGICPWLGIVVQGELGAGSTVSATIVGSTAHTYIAVGSLFGTTTSFGAQGLNMSATYNHLALWE